MHEDPIVFFIQKSMFTPNRCPRSLPIGSANLGLLEPPKHLFGKGVISMPKTHNHHVSLVWCEM